MQTRYSSSSNLASLESIFEKRTLPENPLLGSDVRLQLGSSDVDADGLWHVTDSLRYNSFGRVSRLEPSRLQPHIFTLVVKHKVEVKILNN